MTQHITLTAEQANTLNTTGRLEGFKELCEWQPPRITRAIAGMDDDGTWFCNWENDWYQSRRKELTPTRAVGQVYEVESPWEYSVDRPSSRLPDPEPIHAKIATEPTLSIHEGKLVWTYDLVKE